MPTNLILATRKSAMAMAQALSVKAQLEDAYPNLTIDILGLSTQGDENTNTPLTDMGGKSLFVKTLQEALLSHQADIAVHCIKDMSVHPVPGLQLAAVCQRDDPRDAFISNDFTSIAELPHQAIVGTSSPRRACLLNIQRPDLVIKTCRGNVQTRLKKLDAGEYDAILLSHSGLHRVGLAHRIKASLPLKTFIPAIGQGALGLECRLEDENTQTMCRLLNHHDSALTIAAERAVNQRLGGDCHTPIAAHATLEGDTITLTALVGDADTGNCVTACESGPRDEPQLVGIHVADTLISKGAQNFLT